MEKSVRYDMTRGELSRVFANQGQTSVAIPYPNPDFRDKKLNS